VTAARALTGKALPSPSRSSLYSSAGLPMGGTPSGASVERISQTEASRHISSYGGDQAIDTVNNCVNVYVDAMLSAKWRFIQNGETYIPRRVPDSPPEAKVAPEDLVALLEQPNPYQDWNEFLSLMAIDYLLVGNFYWLKFRPLDGTNRPIALYRLNPSDITVIPGKTDLIAGYEYRLPGAAEPVRFPADLVIHGRRPNPHNPYLGLGIISAGARMLDIELALTETQAQFFEQGAKLSGVLQSDRRVPDPVFKKISNQFRSMYSGSRNAYKIAVLEQGLKFQSIQPTAAESEFVALSQLSFERQTRLFRIPPELLGGVDKTGVLQEAKRQFTNDTMRPLLDRLQMLITLGLTRPGWGYDFEFDYKYVLPREDQLKLVAGFASLPGVRVNEIRAEAGLPPLPEDEVDHDGKPIGDMIVNLPGKSTEQPGGHADRPMPGEVGRPPLPENTMAFPQRGTANAARPDGFGAPAGAAPATTGKALQDAGKQLALRQAIVEDTEDYIRESLKQPLRALERSLMDTTASGKAIRKDERGRVTAAVEESDAWPGFEAAVERVLALAAERGLANTAAVQRAEGYNVPEISFVELGRELASRETGAKSISKTLRERVVRQVAEGVRRGYSTSQIVEGYGEENYDGLRSVLKNWSDSQVTLIGRTEAAHYYNEGILRVAEASGSGQVLVTDGDYDPACQAANGSVWSIEEARANRLEHPNCTRSFLPA